ncbi:hypothetical protein, partial [Pseudomonas sp. AAC]|uniref:hypothetical protein n=1 Tax=Pseudomonas sp. AAC TaxID=1502784 RepID=UPI001C444B29
FNQLVVGSNPTRPTIFQPVAQVNGNRKARSLVEIAGFFVFRYEVCLVLGFVGASLLANRPVTSALGFNSVPSP